jgi:hypothetical protein
MTALPSIVAQGNAVSNTVTATSWAVLPTGPLTASVTNADPTLSLNCLVYYGYTAYNNARIAYVSVWIYNNGSLYLGADPGQTPEDEGQEGIHDFYLASSTGQCNIGMQISLPPSAYSYDFQIVAKYSGAAGNVTVANPSIRIIPISYL